MSKSEKLYEMFIGDVKYQVFTDWDDTPQYMLILNEHKDYITLKLEFDTARQLIELAEYVVNYGREDEDY